MSVITTSRERRPRPALQSGVTRPGKIGPPHIDLRGKTDTEIEETDTHCWFLRPAFSTVRGSRPEVATETSLCTGRRRERNGSDVESS